jgi:perosamine synthetase
VKDFTECLAGLSKSRRRGDGAFSLGSSSIVGTFMGRDAFTLAASLLALKPDDVVLLPDYLCQEVLKPFMARCRVEFYGVSPELTIEPKQIGIKIAETRPRLVILINYFGFLQPYRREIRRICQEHRVLVLEDCAHSLLTEGSGETGDLCVYSFRKLLPVPDGGALKMGAMTKAEVLRFYPRLCSNALSLLIMLKLWLKVRNEKFSRAGLTSRANTVVPKLRVETKFKRIVPISSFALRGLATSPWQEIVRKRREDYQFWHQWGLQTGAYVPVLPNLPDGVCPLCFPVRIAERDAIRARMADHGVFLKTHWRLPTTIGIKFVNSHSLSSQTLSLPVYPELDPNTRETIVRVLTEPVVRNRPSKSTQFALAR